MSTDICEYSDTCCSDDDNLLFDSDEDEYGILEMEKDEIENHKYFINDSDSDTESLSGDYITE